MNELEILLSGTEIPDLSLSETIPLRRINTSGSQIRLEEILHGSDNDTRCIAVLQGESAHRAASLPSVLNKLESIDNSIICIFTCSTMNGIEASFRQLPKSAFVLAQNPFEHSVVVVQRELVARACESGKGDISAWEWLAQVVRHGEANVSIQETQVPTENSIGVEQIVLPPLTPKQPAHDWLSPYLNSFSLEANSPNITSSSDAIAFRAGLYQLHDFLDESHSLSQSVEGRGRNHAGDYWHAIMHRREGDYGNSQYWFRRVGMHPVYSELAQWSDNFLDCCAMPARSEWSRVLGIPHQWRPERFVDICREAVENESPEEQAAAEWIQYAEMAFLLQQTYADAMGR